MSLRPEAALAFAACLVGLAGAPTAACADVVDIAIGVNHACAVIRDGAVKCWGSNAYGKLGDGTTDTRATPAGVLGLGGSATQVAAGTDHTCALVTAGRVKCWGSNAHGQLGDGSYSDRPLPADVAGLAAAVAIAAGGHRSCALLADGQVLCWGWAYAVFLNCPGPCRADITSYPSPVPVPGFTQMRAISAGVVTDHAIVRPYLTLCGLGADGIGRCTGRFDWPAARYDLFPGVKAIATGGNHACMALASGQVRCTGENWRGQLGGGGFAYFGTQMAAGIDDAIALAAGWDHSCALTADRRLRCWGGTSGDGTTIARATPVDLPALGAGILKVAAGAAASCAITADGSAWCWGANDSGQLGDGTFRMRPSPVAVAGLALTTIAHTPGVESGMWWNPSEPGWGLQITIRGQVIFGTLYVYDETGRPKWYVSSNCAISRRIEQPLECSGELHETAGPAFSGTGSGMRVTPVGSFRLSLSSRDAGTLEYSVNAVARNVAIRRFLFDAGSTAASVNYTDLWWNPAEAGWGTSISHQGATMFIVLYVYDESGRPVWYVASNCSVAAEGGSCNGPLYRVSGSASTAPYEAARVRVSQVGMLRVVFPDPNHATLFWTIDGASGSRSITRQIF
jgi:alpha-tubulin suppressor-like RCC1 family protein